MSNINNTTMTTKQHYTLAFWITLTIAAALLIIGILMPPQGEIDGSVLTAAGILFLWLVVEFGNKAIEEGKTATVKHGDTTFIIGDNGDTPEEDS